MGNLIKGIHHVSLKACNEEEYKITIDFFWHLQLMTLMRA